MMNIDILLQPILLPVLIAVVLALIPGRTKNVREYLSVIGSGAVLYIAYMLFTVKNATLFIPWVGNGIDFDLRLYSFNSAMLLWVNIFTFLIILYSTVKMAGTNRVREYYPYIFLTNMFANGAILSDNLILLLFFWGGIIITLYMLIWLGSYESYKTSLKSLVILGFCDFCLLLGILILWHITGTLKISAISVKPEGLAMVAFLLMVVGAAGKGGAMPFHNWIPDAAKDAPVTVMAFLPASIEKLLGIYLLTRISLNLFQLQPNSTLCIILMSLGAITIVFAVMMALIQKNLKRLLAYHAVSQVGYMILGIGTGIPLAIVGGIFHMLNNAIYKSGLFLAAGAVEQQTGTTDMKKLGGLIKDMPVTGVSFLVCALAISGVWPLNGFVSKEMIFHGSYETGMIIFTIAAWFGAIFTFASFLKAGHSVFLGPRTTEVPEVKESKWPMLVPMVILSALCIFFGVYSSVPLKLFVEPALEGQVMGEHVLNYAHNLDLFNPIAMISMLCLLIALGLHYYGWNKGGKKASLASEPVHHLPLLNSVYDWAEKGIFDFYEQGIKVLKFISAIFYYGIDKPIDFIYEKVVTISGRIVIFIMRAFHNGSYSNYLAWSISGLLAVAGMMGMLIKRGG